MLNCYVPKSKDSLKKNSVELSRGLKRGINIMLITAEKLWMLLLLGVVFFCLLRRHSINTLAQYALAQVYCSVTVLESIGGVLTD